MCMLVPHANHGALFHLLCMCLCYSASTRLVTWGAILEHLSRVLRCNNFSVSSRRGLSYFACICKLFTRRCSSCNVKSSSISSSWKLTRARSQLKWQQCGLQMIKRKFCLPSCCLIRYVCHLIQYTITHDPWDIRREVCSHLMPCLAWGCEKPESIRLGVLHSAFGSCLQTCTRLRMTKNTQTRASWQEHDRVEASRRQAFRASLI